MVDPQRRVTSQHSVEEVPEISQPLRSLENEIWDEDLLEHFLTLFIVPIANFSLTLPGAFGLPLS